MDKRNLLEDRVRLPAQSNLGSLSCNRASQEDARIVASVRQLLGRARWQVPCSKKTFTMRFSERTADQASFVDDSASSSMTHPFFVSLHELTPDRECVLYAPAVVER